MKQFHYEFNDKRSFETTYSQAHTGEMAIANPLSVEAKEDLRKFHFNLGTDNPDYISINKQDYDDKAREAQKIPSIDKNVIRKHNFTLGTDPISYDSTVKSSFTDKLKDNKSRYSIH